MQIQDTGRAPVRLRDPREDEPWFDELTEPAKQIVRREWEREEAVAIVDLEREKDRMVRSLCEGAGLFVGAELVLMGWSGFSFLLTLGIGTGLGWAWGRFGWGRDLSGLSGLAAILVIRALCGLGNPILAAVQCTLVIAGSAALGLARESSRSSI
jgi:hypothetical protein